MRHARGKCVRPHGHPGKCKSGYVSEEDYEVECITAERCRKKKTEYLVKWKGWPAEDSTWEPAAALKSAPRKLAEWRRAVNASSATKLEGYSGGDGFSADDEEPVAEDEAKLVSVEDANKGEGIRVAEASVESLLAGREDAAMVLEASLEAWLARRVAARAAEVARTAEVARAAEVAKAAEMARAAEVARAAEEARAAEVAKAAEMVVAVAEVARVAEVVTALVDSEAVREAVQMEMAGWAEVARVAVVQGAAAVEVVGWMVVVMEALGSRS